MRPLRAQAPQRGSSSHTVVVSALCPSTRSASGWRAADCLCKAGRQVLWRRCARVWRLSTSTQFSLLESHKKQLHDNLRASWIGNANNNYVGSYKVRAVCSQRQYPTNNTYSTTPACHKKPLCGCGKRPCKIWPGVRLWFNLQRSKQAIETSP